MINIPVVNLEVIDKFCTPHNWSSDDKLICQVQGSFVSTTFIDYEMKEQMKESCVLSHYMIAIKLDNFQIDTMNRNYKYPIPDKYYEYRFFADSYEVINR